MFGTMTVKSSSINSHEALWVKSGQNIMPDFHQEMIRAMNNEYPLKPHFYIAKLGYAGVTYFSYFCSNT